MGNPLPSPPPAAARIPDLLAATSPCLPVWALLDTHVFRVDDGSFADADESTEAVSTNSKGDRIHVRFRFRIREPPKPSRLYLCWPGGNGASDNFFIVAAHRDAVLFQMTYRVSEPGCLLPTDMFEYFVYRAGGSSSRSRPSLDLINSIEGTIADFRAMIKDGRFRITDQRIRRRAGLDIAVLSGGQDFAVAELEVHAERGQRPWLGLNVFKLSRGLWVFKRPEIKCSPGVHLNNILWDWYGDKVFPFGCYLCWVDYCVGGMFYCKVLDEEPVLNYMELPGKLRGLHRDLRGTSFQTMGANEELGLLKFVMVTDADGALVEDTTEHRCSFHVTSWTMKIQDMRWSAPITVKSDDLLGPGGFKELPYNGLHFPLISMVNLEIVYFICLIDNEMTPSTGPEMLLVAINLANKTVISCSPYVQPKVDGLSAKDALLIRESSEYVGRLVGIELPKYMKLDGASFKGQDHGNTRKRSHSALDL